MYFPEFLANHRTIKGQTFQQYTWELVCTLMRPGQAKVFGLHLLKDDILVRQTIGLKSGQDLIPEQVRELVHNWLTVHETVPTWGQFLECLSRHQNLNAYRRFLETKGLHSRKLGNVFSINWFEFLYIIIIK